MLISILSNDFINASNLENNRLGVVSSAGGRVKAELSCKTARNSRYRIQNLTIYDSSINNPNRTPSSLFLQFSLDPSSRDFRCNEEENYQRYSNVIEIDAGYETYIDPRHRGRSGHHFVLNFKRNLPGGLKEFELHSPTGSLPCNDLLPRNFSVRLTCR